jgi:Protein of unknown function (DUF2934)
MKVTVKKSTAKDTNENSCESAVDLREQIRRRAYEFYERRGREDGHEVEDWLQAEAELAGERNKPLVDEAVKKIVTRRSQALQKQKPSKLEKSRSSAQSKTEEARNGH